MLAFGLTGFDEEYGSIEDSDYGEVKAYYKTWGMVDAPGVEFVEIPTSQCTLAQLGVNQDGSQKEKEERQKDAIFYPTHRNSVNDLKNYHKKFKCADSGWLKMQGDYNSAVTRSYVIQFEKCEQAGRSRKCQDDQTILKWLRRKFIITYANQRRFVIEKFDVEEKIIEESRTNWIPINSQIREEIVFKLKMTDLLLQDERVHWGGLADDTTRVFKFEETAKRPYEFDNKVHISITFEVDLDLTVIDR